MKQRISITLQLRVVINRDVQESLANAITKAHDSSAALGGYEGIQQINAWNITLKVHSVGYNAVADNMVNIHSLSCCCPPNLRNPANFSET